jgi:hypothetical protein
MSNIRPTECASSFLLANTPSQAFAGRQSHHLTSEQQAQKNLEMQAIRHVRQRFLQAIAAELSGGHAATCWPMMQTHAHSSVAQPSSDTEEPHLQRFFKTASVAADPEVTMSTPLRIFDMCADVSGDQLSSLLSDA